MANDWQETFRRASQVTLAPQEKLALRAQLELRLQQLAAVRAESSARHLRQERIKPYGEGVKLSSIIFKPMVIAFAIALVIGGGTALAAESALPGDLLYPIKVDVNEEVRSLTAVSGEEQARWDARRAERRLEEVEELAAEGRLSQDISSQVSSRFEGSAQAFHELASEVGAGGGSDSSFDLRSGFEASLKAHERILSKLAEGDDPEDKKVEPLLMGVRARLNETVAARTSVEAKVSAETGEALEAAARSKLRAAESAVAEARARASKRRTEGGASARTEANVIMAEETIARGKAELESKATGKAIVSFQEALRLAKEARLLLNAEDKMNIELNGYGEVDGRGSSGGQIELEDESIDVLEAGVATGSAVEVQPALPLKPSGSAGAEAGVGVGAGLGL